MRPVMTHPMVGVILNRWVIVDASSSLSCLDLNSCVVDGAISMDTYRDFLLCDHDRGVLAAHRDGCVSRARDRFECILCVTQSYISFQLAEMRKIGRTDLV